MTNWIKCSEEMPETKVRVLVRFINTNGKHWVTCAEYIAPRSVLEEDYMDENHSTGGDYEEEKDCNWTESGFYEYDYEPEINWRLTEKVTHWMPLPHAPDTSESPSDCGSRKEAGIYPLSKLTEIIERVKSFNDDPNLYGVVMKVQEMNFLISLLKEQDKTLMITKRIEEPHPCKDCEELTTNVCFCVSCLEVKLKRDQEVLRLRIAIEEAQQQEERSRLERDEILNEWDETFNPLKEKMDILERELVKARQIIAQLQAEQTIPWLLWDPANPPILDKSYLVTDGQSIEKAWFTMDDEDPIWYLPDLRSINSRDDITHFALISFTGAALGNKELFAEPLLPPINPR
mgnify:CR=1 FL=1